VLEAKPAGRSVTWLGYDSPHGTAYLPFFGAATEAAPEAFHSHEGYMSKYSTKVAWWAFNIVNQHADINFQLINADVRAKSKEIETQGQKFVEACSKMADKATDEVMANEVLTACSNTFAEKKVAEWWEFAGSLFAKFGRYSITFNETAQGELPMVYPVWWLNAPDVGYSMWTPNGPFHGRPVFAAGMPSSSSPGSASLLVSLACASAVGALGYRLGMQRGLQLGKDVGDVYVMA